MTDHTQTLAALRESEARFRAALDAGSDAFVIANAVRDGAGELVDFLVVDASIRAAALVGLPVSALVGRPLLEAFPLSKTTRLWEQCVEVVHSRVPFAMSQAAPVPEMPGRWVQRQIVPLGDGVAISSRDVTTQQREHEALEASEARHRQLFEASAAIQMIVDVDSGSLIDVNPAAEAFYGWPRESMRTMRIMDFNGTSLEDWIVDGSDARGRSERPAICRHRIATGERRDVEIAASPVVIDGRHARHLIVHDITDRIQAEVQLRESEARFRAVINDMSEGVVVHDASGAIRVFNPEAERILGLTGAQLVGLQPVAHDWQAVHEDGTVWLPTDHPAMRALRSGRRQPRTLMEIRRGDAAHVWLQVTADPLIRTGEQLPYAAVAVFSDVTAQRQTEERLRQAQKLEAIGQLAGGIAHDLNNILTVIRGATGFLHESLDEASPSLVDVRAIEGATARAEALTNQLLAVGRRQWLRTEEVDLSALIQNRFATIRDELPSTIRVSLSLRDEPVLVRIDRQQALDAVRTLVDNARAAMPDGGTLTLTTTVRRIDRPPTGADHPSPQPFAVLEVADTGIGMSEDVRNRLFEPFFSTQPFGTNAGMGLASVHGMVTQCHGFIECESMPGRGTTMRLCFPLAAAPEVIATPSRGTEVQGALSILLVDDDAMLRESARRMLDRQGHRVLAAASGSDALALLESSADALSILVTDLTMPGMGGMELIAAVQQRYPQLPIVAISGFSMDEFARRELDARQVTFLGKPFDANGIALALKRALALS
ncbi:MAG: PAS domain S-box protein [Gemmatimonadaceae bacterium]|nr:PAS domain S-box protein [Gemmatimonadaceae bacterium]